MTPSKRRLYVYIDGFSFYYGLTRHTAYKWCDVYALSQELFPTDEILAVKLYAGKSLSTPINPLAPERQNAYFRALRTNPIVSVIDSEFRAYDRNLPLANDYTKTARVKVYKEKKSDVNLATQMIIDAVNNEFDCAVIVTNDIDFVEPIKRTRYSYKKPVYLVPTILFEKEEKKKEGEDRSFIANELLRYSTNKKFVRFDMLKKCQLPKTLRDDKGEIHKPPEWNQGITNF